MPPHPGDSYVVIGDRQVGIMSWAEDGTDTIAVWGDTVQVEAVAMQVADQLGGTFVCEHS
jgi:hypothetical protein